LTLPIARDTSEARDNAKIARGVQVSHMSVSMGDMWRRLDLHGVDEEVSHTFSRS